MNTYVDKRTQMCYLFLAHKCVQYRAKKERGIVMKKLYGNVGKKIQKLGFIIGLVLLIAGVGTFIIMNAMASEIRDADMIWAYIAPVIGVVGFVSSWFMYAFGQLVNDVHAMREKMGA